MNTPLIQKSKWFWGWDGDKEEAWLTEMAKQGLHLQRAALFGKYTFAEGEPREMAYRLDFVPSNKKDESYFQLFRDGGWEHVGELSSWQYWRKEVKPGQEAEIFTDPESKSRKYQFLFRLELIAGLILVADILYLSGLALKYRASGASGWLCILLFSVPSSFISASVFGPASNS